MSPTDAYTKEPFVSSIPLWMRTDRPRPTGMDYWKGPTPRSSLSANPRSILVDVHSVASWYGFAGAYSATKAALWSATNSLRLELAPRGVHVTGVHMGYVETRMAAHADGPKLAPGDLVTKVYDAVEANEYEVIGDELTAQIKAA
ncbi:SDR family NAD(P)-dependent oxidoreductase [Kribbella sp. NBC_00662]|uniref:SDR family NAD(P)-dependent oxidoreductase n=1 Tax=Kribbella sp. NBC_00662 TaxID=2975969 RepID=UPI0032514947